MSIEYSAFAGIFIHVLDGRNHLTQSENFATDHQRWFAPARSALGGISGSEHILTDMLLLTLIFFIFSFSMDAEAVSPCLFIFSFDYYRGSEFMIHFAVDPFALGPPKAMNARSLRGSTGANVAITCY